MRTKTLGRLLGAATLAASFAAVAAGTASASTPNWSMHVVDLPDTVHNGANAGYSVTISNGGPSNISQLFLVTGTLDSPTYVVTSQGSCTAVGAGPLTCTFGALNAGSSVVVTVAYKTPSSGSSYDPVFEANSNGATFTDPRHTSHGDTLVDPNETATALTTSGDQGGGFSIVTGTVQDDPNLSKSNVQSTAVNSPFAGVPVTVQDGPKVTVPCSGCGTLWGEWSKINVNNGQVVPNGGLFPVTLMVYGKAVPSNVTIDNVFVIHVLDNGTPVPLTTRCGTTPTLNCITVTRSGNNWKIVAWLNQNGHVRGGGP